MRALQYALIFSLVSDAVRRNTDAVRRDAEQEHQVDGGVDESTSSPLCSKVYSVNDFVGKVTKWCDPMRVPATHRPPEKLQGLFWLKDIAFPEVAVCFSTGLWNQSTRTLTLRVWTHVVVPDTSAGKEWIPRLYRQGMRYAIKFDDDSLTNATMKQYTVGGLKQKLMGLPIKMFGWFWTLGLTEDKTAPPGDKWKRPNKLFNLFNFGAYEIWRLFDGKFKVNPENNAAMLKQSKNWSSSNVRLYWQTSPKKPCNMVDPTENSMPISVPK
eukprot:TRINITY_DN4665_c0_g4_i1.p1 TRINITY_DN4665_c0_g4~~TRINITY_DN4665_c0_g4_i1.p1  ORF type:complete len:309 (+),score=17.15 TRINITY_DN4665_c0_g4_i1:122-928(+)